MGPIFGVHEWCYVKEPSCYGIFFVSENLADRLADVVVDAGTTASDHQPVVLKMN